MESKFSKARKAEARLRELRSLSPEQRRLVTQAAAQGKLTICQGLVWEYEGEVLELDTETRLRHSGLLCEFLRRTADNGFEYRLYYVDGPPPAGDWLLASPHLAMGKFTSWLSCRQCSTSVSLMRCVEARDTIANSTWECCLHLLGEVTPQAEETLCRETT